MKVTLFHLTLGGGGIERIRINIARGLIARGFDVDMVLASAEGPNLSLVPPQVRVIDLGASRLPRDVPRVVLGLARYLRKERPKCILASCDHYNFLPLVAREIGRSDTRVVVSFHINMTKRSKNTRTLKAKLIPFCMRMFLPLADGVIAVSKGVADDLSRLTGFPRERVRVVYNPVVTPDLFERMLEPVDHPWFQRGQPPVVLGVGRLTRQKDFSTLIRAFARVLEERDARLVILGEGEERRELEALVGTLRLEGRVALPGFVTNPYPYMRQAAVFVLSSSWEGFGNVLVEAMAAGTPVVSTDCPDGPSEILEGGKWGKLVPVGDVEALARGILASLDEPRNSSTCRAMRFSVDAIMNEYCRVIYGE